MLLQAVVLTLAPAPSQAQVFLAKPSLQLPQAKVRPLHLRRSRRARHRAVGHEGRECSGRGRAARDGAGHFDRLVQLRRSLSCSLAGLAAPRAGRAGGPGVCPGCRAAGWDGQGHVAVRPACGTSARPSLAQPNLLSLARPDLPLPARLLGRSQPSSSAADPLAPPLPPPSVSRVRVVLPPPQVRKGLAPVPRLRAPGRPHPQVRHGHLPPVLPREGVGHRLREGASAVARLAGSQRGAVGGAGSRRLRALAREGTLPLGGPEQSLRALALACPPWRPHTQGTCR